MEVYKYLNQIDEGFKNKIIFASMNKLKFY